MLVEHAPEERFDGVIVAVVEGDRDAGAAGGGRPRRAVAPMVPGSGWSASLTDRAVT